MLDCYDTSNEVHTVLWLAVTITLLLWMLGGASTAWEGMLIHLLLIAALAMMLAAILQGGRGALDGFVSACLRRTARRR